MSKSGLDKVKEESMKDAIKVLEMIMKDVEDDATNFDGKELNGRNVAEYFGNHGAAIAALANIIKKHIEEGQ